MKRVSTTCVAAIVDETGKVWMAGDRRLSRSSGLYERAPYPKVAKKNGVLIGASGTWYIAEEVLAGFTPPKKGKEDTRQYLKSKFTDALIEFLVKTKFIKEGELGLDEDIIDDGEGINLLVALEGTIAEIEISSKRISVVCTASPATIGCGGQIALGSLLTDRNELSAAHRLVDAVKVAAKGNSGCDENVDLIFED